MIKNDFTESEYTMSRRPEIGNVQLYPDRPLRKSDRNGYMLKFYCPIRCKRIRRNCETRDRREAKKILRECRERLLNGNYVESDGAIAPNLAIPRSTTTASSTINGDDDFSASWQECYERYIDHRRTRVRERSLDDAIFRLGIAEKILQAYVDDWSMPGGLVMRGVSLIASHLSILLDFRDGTHGPKKET